jgi:hypothetical protein
MDVAIPGDRNVIEKEGEKFLEYKALKIELQRMWNVKTSNNRRRLGSFQNHADYLSNIPGEHEIQEQQKTDVLGTAHILR